MEEQRELTEFERQRKKLQELIDRGEHFAILFDSPEWQFYVGELEKVYDELRKAIMKPNYRENSVQRAEDFNRGFADALRFLIDTPVQATRRRQQAIEELHRREEAQEEADGGL